MQLSTPLSHANLLLRLQTAGDPRLIQIYPIAARTLSADEGRKGLTSEYISTGAGCEMAAA